MSTAVTDETFIAALLEARLVSPEKVEAAHQAREAGSAESATEYLIQSGEIPAALKEVMEQRLLSGVTSPLKKLGQYVLIQKLGEGGMGAVFKGITLSDGPIKDEKFGTYVAIKVLKKEISEHQNLVDRFQREAASAVILRHENVVSARGVGHDDGFHFYVMDFFEGEPLDVLLKRDKRVPVARATEIIADAARGLEYAHQLNFIHRDIKPANIYVTAAGPSKLLDFGLVKNIDTPNQQALTAPGTMMGSPHYISPEQIRAEAELTGQTDIYSLGATFFHLVCGRPPFQGDSAAMVIMAHVSQPVPDPRLLAPDVSEGLAKVIHRMLAKERNDRYKNCTELLADLQLVKEGKVPESLLHAEYAPNSKAAVHQPIDENAPTVIDTSGCAATIMLDHENHPMLPAKSHAPKMWWQFWRWFES